MSGGACVGVSAVVSLAGPGTIEGPVHHAAGASRHRERLTVCDVCWAERVGGPRRRSDGPRWLGRIDHPHVRGCVGGTADQRDPVTMGAQARDRHAGLRDHVRRPRCSQAHHGVAPGGGLASHDGPVGQFRERALAQDPVGTVEFVRGVGERHGSGRPPAPGVPGWTYGCHHPRRSETKRSVPSLCQAGCPIDSSCPPATTQGLPAGMSTSSSGSEEPARPSWTTTRDEASHCMFGCSQTTTASRAAVASTRGAPKKSCPASSVDSDGLPLNVERATMLRCGGRASFVWVSRTASTQRPSAVALSPPWRWADPSGASGESGRGDRTPRCGRLAVAEPHPLVRLVHVGEGARGPAGHEAHGPAAVFVHPAPDAHARRRVVLRAVGARPHEHDAPVLLGS